MDCIRYDTDVPVRSKQGALLLYCTISRYDSSWASVLHSHTHAELFCCISGKGRMQAAGEIFPVKKGDCVLVNAYVTHTEYSDPSDPLGYIVLGVDGVSFMDEENHYYRCKLWNERTHALVPYFEDIVRELSRRQAGYMDVCSDIMSIILSKLSRHLSLGINDDVHGSTVCAEVRRIIDESFADDLTLDDLAQHAGISKFYLSHTFQKFYGISPMQCLTRRRIQEVMHLLLNTDYSHDVIAQMTGFSSASYLSQAFKRIVGMNPSDYRRKGGLPADSMMDAAQKNFPV